MTPEQKDDLIALVLNNRAFIANALHVHARRMGEAAEAATEEGRKNYAGLFNEQAEQARSLAESFDRLNPDND